MKSNV